MNQQPEHLSDAQITEYLSESREGNLVLSRRNTGSSLATSNAQIAKNPLENDEGSPVLSSDWREIHFKSCEECTRRVLAAFPEVEGFRPRDRVSAGPDPGCPPQQTLDEIAAGIASSEITAHNLRHVSDCDFCGPLLRELLEQYSPNVAPEDEALLAEVQRSAEPWRKMMVREMIGETTPQQRPSWWALMVRPWVLAGTAAATLLTGGSLMTVPAMLATRDLKKADRLLVEASAAHDRVTPVRVTGEPYSDYRVQLAGENATNNHLGDDLNLLRAKVLVESKIASTSGGADPRWLQLKARIALLEGGQANFAVAEQSLKEAIARASDTPSLRIDLAATYFKQDFQRGAQQPLYARTIDMLNDVLKTPGLAPRDRAVALFDLAYAYEAIGLKDTEKEKWNEYLKIDSSGDWASEARERLEKAVKIPVPGPQSEDPPDFLHLTDEQREARLEQYIDIALRKWLHPAIKFSSGEFPPSDAALALQKLAKLTAGKEHSDPLLKDFLARLTKTDLPAVDELSAAWEDNLNDRYEDDGTELKSTKAARWFARRGNLPGELLARFATVYRLQRGLKGAACLSEIKEISGRLPSHQYHWLEGQLELEKAQCANLMTDYKQTEDSLARSHDIAALYHFPDLDLRVIGIDAGIKRLHRDYPAAWEKCMAGLKQYWSNPRPPERLYQFYSVLSQTARDLNLLRATEALLRQQIKIRENYFKDDTLMLAVLHMGLANSLRDDETSRAAPGEVESETKQALELSREAPTGQKSLLYSQVSLANNKLRRAEESMVPAQKRRQALLALEYIEPVSSLLDNQDNFLQLDFHRVRANAERQLGRLNEAVMDYQSALERSELALRAIRDNVSRARWILKTDEIDHGLTWTLLKRNEDTKALYVWERLRSRSLASDNDGDPPLKGLELENAAFVPAAPAVSEMHLIYAAFRDGVQIWMVNGPVVKGIWVDIEREHLAELVRNFANQCADRKKTSDQALELYTKLLQPVINDLPKDRPVVVELDQTLARLPIEALPLPLPPSPHEPSSKAEEEFFGIKYQVVRSPGIFAQKILRKSQLPQTQQLFLFVDPSRLPGHQEQAEAVQHVFPHTQVLDARDVERTQITRSLSASYGFHFTGHGTGTELELRPGFSLTARDFTPATLSKVQLAVLAACSTGSTTNGTVDADNLVRSFLVAGVPAIVSSQWNVDAAGTADLMKSFYTHLGNGDSPAAALQKARREMASSRDTTRNLPYTWAAFTLTGRTD